MKKRSSLITATQMSLLSYIAAACNFRGSDVTVLDCMIAGQILDQNTDKRVFQNVKETVRVLVGDGMKSSAAKRIAELMRDFAQRQAMPHQWINVDRDVCEIAANVMSEETHNRTNGACLSDQDKVKFAAALAGYEYEPHQFRKAV